MGARFTADDDLSGAVFRETDLSGARMRGVLLNGADLDGVITGLVVNGVEVEPLVEAELDRRYPERTKLRPTTADGVREAWATVEAFWGVTMARAATLPDADLHRSVDEEWSFVDTLRHLVFVTDTWLGQAVLGTTPPYHPVGLPAAFMTDVPVLAVPPTTAEVLAARADRIALVRDFVAGLTQDELDRERSPNPAPGWPPPKARTARQCLGVIFNEEWAHHRFAVRDLGF